MIFFKGRTAVLATMHGKEKVIAPILENELGIKIIVPENFDTDQFGTFTMDKKRKGNQLEAARYKAHEAMKLTGLDLAIASEGSFGPDSQIPFVNSNTEIVILIDKKNNLEIIGFYKTLKNNAHGKYVKTFEEVLNFANKIGFPEHAVVLRQSHNGVGNIFKGIKSLEDLEKYFKKIMSGFFIKEVYVESDLRAHMNPTRMENIKEATLNLFENIKSECPECGTPGFSISDHKTGLICLRCRLPTDSVKSYIRKCQKCKFEKEIPVPDEFLEDAGMCNWCNP